VAVEDLISLADEDWDKALAASGARFRFSHRAAAGRALEASYPSYRYEPYRVVYRDGTTILLPIIRVARRLSALTMMLGMPFGLEGTPITLRGQMTAAHIRSLFGALGGQGLLSVSGGSGGSPPAVGQVTPGVTHTLDLRPGFDALWATTFSGRCRNSCRKAENAGVGVELRREVTPKAADAYYRLYVAAARGWGYAEPPYPRALFDALLGSDTAELWLAHFDNRTIAGALLLRGSDDLLYWSGAMNRDFQRVAPSNAVLRAVIESACRRGIEVLDFGASRGLPGVEKFKLSFGAQARSYRSVALNSRAYGHLELWRSRLSRRRAPRQ
jgi:Acetyltransferase (GNAT) domain